MLTAEVTKTRRRVLQGIAATPLALGLRAHAQTSRPIRLVAPFSAGGPTDSVARTIAASMANELGQPVIVENKAGANGVIAAEHVANSAPDGHTLLYHTSAFTTGAALAKHLPYDPINDFAFVGMTTSVPLVLLVHPNSPARTPAEFAAHLKANPGKLTYGAVLQSIVHVAPEQMFHALGAKAVAVPYKGTAPALTDLIGQQIDFAFDAINSALPFVQGGRLRAIGIASLQRVKVLPDVPTFAETILPGFEAGTWGGVMAPARTPPDTVTRLNRTLLATLAVPAFRDQLEKQGLRIVGGSPAEFRAFVADEIARWKKVASTTRFTTD